MTDAFSLFATRPADLTRVAELVSDAESDGVAFCTPGSTDASCSGRLMDSGFIRAAAIERAGDGSWIQVRDDPVTRVPYDRTEPEIPHAHARARRSPDVSIPANPR